MHKTTLCTSNVYNVHTIHIPFHCKSVWCSYHINVYYPCSLHIHCMYKVCWVIRLPFCRPGSSQLIVTSLNCMKHWGQSRLWGNILVILPYTILLELFFRLKLSIPPLPRGQFEWSLVILSALVMLLPKLHCELAQRGTILGVLIIHHGLIARTDRIAP